MAKKLNQTSRRKLRVRKKIKANTYLPRVVVFRSNKYLSAQLLDTSSKVLLALSENKLNPNDKKKPKSQRAQALGTIFGKKVNTKKIKKIIFDRGPYKYHGRVKAFAEALRAEGLKF